MLDVPEHDRESAAGDAPRWCRRPANAGRAGSAFRRGFLLATLAAGLSTPLASQAVPPLAPHILTLPVSVRAAALGGASVALNGDASATFLNPAGLATIRNIAVEGAINRYGDGSLEGFAAGAFRLLQFDLGGGVHYLRFADDSAAVKDNLQWTASGVYRFGFIAAGGTLKYVSLEDSAGATRRSATVDAGLGIHVFDLMTLAFTVRNLESWRVSGGPLLLPMSKHAAFAFNFTDPQESGRLLGTMEVIWQDRASRRTVLGLEAGAVLSRVGLVARLGYGAAPEGAGQKRLSLGGGLVFRHTNLDYAWQRRTRLGRDVHRFGLRFTL